jgi:hypothetical protein
VKFKVFNPTAQKDEIIFAMKIDDSGDLIVYVVTEAGEPIPNGEFLRMNHFNGETAAFYAAFRNLGIPLDSHSRLRVKLED